MKIARLEKDMNQEDLAKAVGVTRQTIGMIESGNYNPTLKLCVAICDALDKTSQRPVLDRKGRKER